MDLSARNWIWESGVAVAYSGTSFPSNDVLLSGNTAKLWKATTAGTVGFTLGASRTIGGVGVCYMTTGSAVSQSVTVRVRTGGAGGSIVATALLDIPATTTEELIQRAASAFLAAPVTGDYVEFVLGAGALPVHAWGFWAGPSLHFGRYTIEYFYDDPTELAVAMTGTVTGNRERIVRDVSIVLQDVVDDASIGASTNGSASFADLLDALGWAGPLPTLLTRTDDIEFADTLGDIETTMLLRLTNAAEISKLEGPKHRVPLRLKDA